MKVHQYCEITSAIHRLRINVKSLAAEARYIRQEERRCGSCYRNELYLHRTRRLREESRHAQLALAFLRGRSYQSVEGCNSKWVDLACLMGKLRRFTSVQEESVSNWLAGA